MFLHFVTTGEQECESDSSQLECEEMEKADLGMGLFSGEIFSCSVLKQKAQESVEKDSANFETP